ncbi:MAG: hypothetical protein IKP79_02390, partial [Bacilli bacterium]|nr:hypothetical protein [Bacilli bacterium]
SIVNLMFAPSFVLKSLTSIDMFKDNTKLLLGVFLGYLVISILLIISSAWKIAKCNKILKIIYFILLAGFLVFIAIFGMGFYVAVTSTISMFDTAKMNHFTSDVKLLMLSAEEEWITDSMTGKNKYTAYAQGITCTKVETKNTEVVPSEQEEVTVDVDKNTLLDNNVVETKEKQSVDSDIVPTVNALENDRLTGLTYFIGLNEDGKIVDLYATDGMYVIATHNESGLDALEINSVKEKATVKTPDENVRLISSFEGKTSVSFTCSYDDNEYKVSATLK